MSLIGFGLVKLKGNDSMLREYPYAELAPGIYEIDEYDNASMYLLAGTERALLIDTGIGIGNVREFAESLTNLPMEVFLTHNHRDHVGNAPLFERVHISEIDRHMGAMLRPLTTKESRLQYARHTCSSHPGKKYPWSEDDMFDFTAEREPYIVSIGDGFIFHLGGRNVICWHCPGHTPGSMVAIDSQTGYLFCGDACNHEIGLGIRPIEGMRHATVEEAWIALKRIWAMDFDKTHIYNGHRDYRELGSPLDVEVFPEAMCVMEQILSGVYRSESKHIAKINADVEVVTINGMEIQFHRENVYGIGKEFIL